MREVGKSCVGLRSTTKRWAVAATCSACLVFGAGSAWAAEEDEDPIATDRPGNGNAATVVAPFRYQLETSVNYALTGANEDSLLISLPTLFRFGLIQPLELRVGTGIVGFSAGDDASDGNTAHSTDTSIGFKSQALSGEGARPDLALMMDVFLPSGRGPFTNDAVVPEARLAAAWSLPAGFGLLLNGGADIPEVDTGAPLRERRVRGLYVVNVGYVLPALEERLSVFVESFGRVPFSSDSDPEIQVDAGGALLLSPNLQVDIFTQHGLTDAAADFQIAIGLSARL